MASIVRTTLAIATGAALGVGATVFAATTKQEIRVPADIHVVDRVVIDVAHAQVDAGAGGLVTRQIATAATFTANATINSIVVDEEPQKVTADGEITGQCKQDALAMVTSCVLPAIKAKAKMP